MNNNEAYRNGDKIRFTGNVDETGAREFVWLEGVRKGQTGVTYNGTKIGDDLNVVKAKNQEELRAGFARLHKES